MLARAIVGRPRLLLIDGQRWKLAAGQCNHPRATKAHCRRDSLDPAGRDRKACHHGGVDRVVDLSGGESAVTQSEARPIGNDSNDSSAFNR